MLRRTYEKRQRTAELGSNCQDCRVPSASTLWSPEAEIAINRHYQNCLIKADMTNKQLAINLSNYVDGKPELQGKPVQGGLINYLVEMCGAPPQ